MKAERVLYGGIAIHRMVCPACGGTALVIDGRSACCNEKLPTPTHETHHRESSGASVRDIPKCAERAAILEEQDHRCVYCQRLFGSYVFRSTDPKPRQLKIHWDHFVAWSQSLNNQSSNFVAACQLCNGLKSDKFFIDIVSAREYINARLKAKGYSTGSV